MFNLPFIMTLYAGFTHAFETDHLLAVSNMVTRRSKTIKAVKDGMYWGLGHTSTILLTGIGVLLLKFQVNENYFGYFEALVGVMLIFLGVYRIVKWYKERKPFLHTHPHLHGDGRQHSHTHLHYAGRQGHQHSHLPAYQVGLVHGLAGSGSLMLLVMSQSKSVSYGLVYLIIFGFGSVLGMMIAAGVFSLPFSQQLFRNQKYQMVLVFLSATLCIVYGGWVIFQNLIK